MPHPDVMSQINRLVEVGYPALGGLDEATFRALLTPLADLAPPGVGATVVVTRELVSPYDAVPLLHLVGSAKPGVVDRNHGEGDLATYEPLASLGVPPGPAYLLLGVERGEEFRNVRPEDALPVITGRGRTPLSIDEGIAVVLQRPELLEKNKCFMLSGSRRHDRRVPAMWISDKAPKLGWCWAGNPHTWLGVASAASRSAT